MYWEEHDLCLRIQNSNHDVIFCAEAKLIHISGTSTSPYFIQMEVEKHRSQKKYVLKHHPDWLLLNRLSGILGYSWRTVASLLTLKKQKIAQHWSIFFWYSFNYK